MLLKGRSIRLRTRVVSIQGCGRGKGSPMRRILIALVTGVLSGHALAADLPVPPPPRAPVAFIPPPPVVTWTGIYIGGNGGYSFGTTTPSLGGLSGAGFSTNGIVAGGTIGGNYQAGVFVFGVEGDFDWDNIKGNPSACIGCQASSTWLATARGRAGVAWDRLQRTKTSSGSPRIGTAA